MCTKTEKRRMFWVFRLKQECIPVGCVPPARSLTASRSIHRGRACPRRGMRARGGGRACPGEGGLCAGRGMRAGGRDVHARGRCLRARGHACMSGACMPGGLCACPGGMRAWRCLLGGCAGAGVACTPPVDRQTAVKT